MPCFLMGFIGTIENYSQSSKVIAINYGYVVGSYEYKNALTLDYFTLEFKIFTTLS